jgi:hypothetical protein
MVAACFGITTPIVAYAEEFGFSEYIKPVIDTKCVVCHACFDAPCQLVLTHADGLVRGASKRPVYDGLRVAPMQSTRLFIDANSTPLWREKVFYGVARGPEWRFS